MGDKIILLPESVSSKIAAGEVIQRPSSVVKELLENSIDACSFEIILKIVDAGKTLIEVIDDGIGMSKNDILMSVKKHATSKIKDFNDLYSLKTMGFRGEGIPSIIAVSDVEISSNNSESNIGIRVSLKDSNINSIEDVVMKKGTIFTVRNIFYNIPARREFLKKDNIEINYIIKEFIRIALINYDKKMKLIVDSNIKYNLNTDSLIKRISAINKDKNTTNLIYVSEKLDNLSIEGYIIKPSSAHRNDEMYIYVNKRYISDVNIKNSIIDVYSELVTNSKIPFCVINISIPQEDIDINISPSKTYIKFKNEELVYNFIHNVIKKKLFYFDTPVLKFDADKYIDGLDFTKYNNLCLNTKCSSSENKENNNFLFDDKEEKKSFYISDSLIITNGYIISITKSGVLLLNISRAYKRVVYDEVLKNIKNSHTMSQQMMFPYELYLSYNDINLLKLNYEYLKKIGFTFLFFLNSIKITGVPSFLNVDDFGIIIDIIISVFENKNYEVDIYSELIKNIIISNKYKNITNVVDAKSLMNKLFTGEFNMYDPFNKRIFIILDECSLDDILDN